MVKTVGLERLHALHLFQPRRRHVVLINELDAMWQRRPPGPYCPLNPQLDGNWSLWLMESALRRGIIRLAPEIQQYLADRGFWKMAMRTRRLIDQTVWRMYQKWGGHFPPHRWLDLVEGNRVAAGTASRSYDVLRTIGPLRWYDHSAPPPTTLRKIHPHPENLDFHISDTLSHHLTSLETRLDDTTLTFLFFRAHGNEAEIANFYYMDLFKALNKIPGKKVLVASACNSGAAVRYARHENRDDYVVIADTDEDGDAYPEASNIFVAHVANHIGAHRRLSEFPPRILQAGRHNQQITTYLGFDVIM